jgi:SAM-dependent methyltransferase
MPGPEGVSDYILTNRGVWTTFSAEYAERAPRNWAKDQIEWGVWNVPESEVGALGAVDGLDVIELGCGTAYFSAWLARRGAQPVGVDITPAQLDTARRMQEEFGLRFPLIEASAERVPLRDGTFDLALSEYGASIWCDPYLWVPEAARLLRPGGRLVFLCNSTLLMLCVRLEGAAGPELVRDQFGMHRFDWEDTGEVEFHLSHSDWVRLLRRGGFELLDLAELRPPADATTNYDFVTLEWARRWPSEEIWVAGKR